MQAEPCHNLHLAVLIPRGARPPAQPHFLANFPVAILRPMVPPGGKNWYRTNEPIENGAAWACWEVRWGHPTYPLYLLA